MLVFEALVWALAAISGDDRVSVPGFIGLVLGALAAVLMPIVIVSTRQKDAWTWAVVSLGLSAFGLFIGLMFCLQALAVGCAGECFG